MYRQYATTMEIPNGISNCKNISSEVWGTSIPAVSQSDL